MRKIIRTAIYGICAFGVLFAASLIHNGQPATAEGEQQQQPAVWLQISPVSKRIALNAGQEATDSFTVENTGSADFKYKVYAAPYSVTNENYDLSFSAENNYTRMTSWLSFRTPGGEWTKDPTFSIAKGEKQTIEYRINVPQDAPAGGQYVTLFAESVNEDAEGAATGVKTSSRVGLILYGNIAGDIRRAASIEDYNFSRFLMGGNIKGTSKVKNTGNTDFNVNYTFEVKSLFGKTLYEDKSAVSVLPDTERRINHEWDQTPWIGIFQVHYSVNALGESHDETAVVMVMPLIAIILLLLFLTILVIWTIMGVRKAKERKARTK